MILLPMYMCHMTVTCQHPLLPLTLIQRIFKSLILAEGFSIAKCARIERKLSDCSVNANIATTLGKQQHGNPPGGVFTYRLQNR